MFVFLDLDTRVTVVLTKTTQKCAVRSCRINETILVAQISVHCQGQISSEGSVISFGVWEDGRSSNANTDRSVGDGKIVSTWQRL